MVYKCAVNSDVNNCFEDDKRNIAINLKKQKVLQLLRLCIRDIVKRSQVRRVIFCEKTLNKNSLRIVVDLREKNSDITLK